jgi:hypothetical protein
MWLVSAIAILCGVSFLRIFKRYVKWIMTHNPTLEDSWTEKGLLSVGRIFNHSQRTLRATKHALVETSRL